MSVIVWPDTQSLQSYPTYLTDRASWVVTNKDALKVSAVLHLGDMVNTPTETAEWDVMDSVYDILDAANIPYLIAAGNHDYLNTEVRGGANTFNTYFPTTRYTSKSWWNGGFYEAGKSENAYLIVGDILYMAIEFGPRAVVIDWAKSVIAANPSKKVFIISHSYEYTDGSPVTVGDNNLPYWDGSEDIYLGQEIWDDMVKLYPNVFWVNSGHHVENFGAHHFANGDNGNKVIQVFCNWQNSQTWDHQRIIKFYDGMKTAQVLTHLTHTATYSTTEEDQWSVAL